MTKVESKKPEAKAEVTQVGDKKKAEAKAGVQVGDKKTPEAKAEVNQLNFDKVKQTLLEVCKSKRTKIKN